jgi:hypothetical protein
MYPHATTVKVGPSSKFCVYVFFFIIIIAFQPKVLDRIMLRFYFVLLTRKLLDEWDCKLQLKNSTLLIRV